jgi:hypothetical protein
MSATTKIATYSGFLVSETGTRLGGERRMTALYSGGQTSWQLPHLVHLLWSMTFIPFSSLLMAFTGQDNTQCSQARSHFSGSM